MRYRLFTYNKDDIESWQLPPFAASLEKHCQRANYQAAIWKCSLEACPDIPLPSGNGWSTEVVDGIKHLTVDWTEGPPAPAAVLQ